ncbi:MAG: SLBB domain-containing protein [Ignavibacteriae bacterium]|nr:SLBB domain-containing protein [Ignavibacteriota bacterium]
MSLRRVLMMLACTAVLAGSASAQIETSLGVSKSGASSAAYYFLSKPGEITMSINLWGYVRNPGRYEVPISTDLVQLLSYAGGPLAEADLASVKISRVVRRDDGIRTVEFNVNLRHLDKLDDKARGLEPGDTIFVDSPSFVWRDVFSILTTVAIILASIANAVIATRGL